MPSEPANKRTIAFIDGQNLFYATKSAFGYTFPNYDADALARAVCKINAYSFVKAYFYTGIPDVADNPFWNRFWTAKLAVMGTRGVSTFSRPLRYRTQVISLPGGTTTTVRVGQEKGIDVRLALDVFRLAVEDAYDVAFIFSQDQDLSEVAKDVRAHSTKLNKWIQVACCFPSPNPAGGRGINDTRWIKLDKATYDSCIDPKDYRPKASP